MTTISKELPFWQRVLKRFFLDFPERRLERREETRDEIQKAKPESSEHLVRILVAMAETDGRSLLSWYPNLSTRLVELYGEEIRPKIAPAIKYGIEQNKLEIWTASDEEGDPLMQSEETPEFYLKRSDEDLMKLIDSRLLSLSGYYKLDRKFYKSTVMALTPLLVINALLIWSTTAKVMSVIVSLLIGWGLFCWAWSCIRNNETRKRTGLFFLDIVDMMRFVFISLPLWALIKLVRWPYKVWQERSSATA